MFKIRNKGSSVELPIVKHIFIVKHFPIFSSFLNQIEWLFCHWTHKLKGYKCSLNVINKKATQTRMNDNLLQFFWKSNSRPSPNAKSVSSSFLVYFEWSKTWWVHQLGLSKTSLNSKSKDVTIKDFKLKILIYFNSFITLLMLSTSNHSKLPLKLIRKCGHWFKTVGKTI
jgi:hypothetical protein